MQLEFLGHFIIPRLHLSASDSNTQRPRYLRRIQAEHVTIFEAIEQRSSVAARKAARRHLTNALRRYQEIGSRARSREATERLPADN